MNFAIVSEVAAVPRCASELAFLRYVGAPFEPLFGRLSDGAAALWPRSPPVLVLKMRQALTFLATIQIDFVGMKTLAVISILALLTISGAAYTDQLFTGDQQTMQGAD